MTPARFTGRPVSPRLRRSTAVAAAGLLASVAHAGEPCFGPPVLIEGPGPAVQPYGGARIGQQIAYGEGVIAVLRTGPICLDGGGNIDDCASVLDIFLDTEAGPQWSATFDAFSEGEPGAWRVIDMKFAGDHLMLLAHDNDDDGDGLCTLRARMIFPGHPSWAARTMRDAVIRDDDLVCGTTPHFIWAPNPDPPGSHRLTVASVANPPFGPNVMMNIVDFIDEDEVATSFFSGPIVPLDAAPWGTADLTEVKVHAHAPVSTLGADATALGGVSVAGPVPDPDNPGARLLAHEAAHVVQQQGGMPHAGPRLSEVIDEMAESWMLDGFAAATIGEDVAAAFFYGNEGERVQKVRRLRAVSAADWQPIALEDLPGVPIHRNPLYEESGLSGVNPLFEEEGHRENGWGLTASGSDEDQNDVVVRWTVRDDASLPILREADIVSPAPPGAAFGADFASTPGRVFIGAPLADAGPGEPDTGEVYTAIICDRCPADWDGDGVVNSGDFFAFIGDFLNGDADITGEGVTDSADFFEFIAHFVEGC